MSNKLIYFALNLFTISLIIIGSGCSLGEEIPEGFSKKSYSDFMEIYEGYEECNEKNLKCEGFDVLWEYYKLEEKGELTPEEIEVADILGSLLLYQGSNALEQLDDSGVELITEMVRLEGVYSTPELEERVRNLLQIEEEIVENTEEDFTPEVEIDENCSEVYSEEECKQFMEYYTEGEGIEEYEQANSDLEVNEEEIQANSDLEVNEEEIYEIASWYIKEMSGAPESIYPAPSEESIVFKRDDGLYYVYSIYMVDIKTAPTNSYYEFEMLIDENGELIDAYIPGSYGIFDRPMQYDNLN
ncbi:hypothetical protein ACE106_07345 [Shouchella clausii]|uniref:hypothetical protein n=1 Tax=Shouchella clausii TaxID=79880 RepID=UPI00289E8B23|nr:hypothetical protein [Shouchella clausii]